MLGSRSTLRLAMVLGVAALGLLTTAAPASAHDELLGTDPIEGASLESPPASVTFTFGEAVAPEFTEASVTPPGGAAAGISADRVNVNGLAVTVPLAGIAPAAPAGAWQVVLRIVSTDGHPVESTLNFTAGAAPASPPAADTPATAPDTAAPSQAASRPGAAGTAGSMAASSQAASSEPAATTISDAAAVAGGGDWSTGAIAAVVIAVVVLLGGTGAFLVARRR